MDDKGDAFVQKAFMEAIRNAGYMPEAKVASDSFRKHFKSLIVTAHENFSDDDKKYFMSKNNNEVSARCISQIAKTFFFAGFRKGVLYQKEKQ